MKVYHLSERVLLFTGKRRRKFFAYRRTFLARHWDIGKLRFIVFH